MKEIGTATLQDDVFRYSDSEHGRDAWELAPIAESTHPDSGCWYDPARDGAGLSVHIFPTRAAVNWYTYGRDGKQRWFSCQGESLDSLTIYEVVGGRFAYLSGELIPVGTARLTIEGDSAWWEYGLSA